MIQSIQVLRFHLLELEKVWRIFILWCFECQFLVSHEQSSDIDPLNKGNSAGHETTISVKTAMLLVLCIQAKTFRQFSDEDLHNAYITLIFS